MSKKTRFTQADFSEMDREISAIKKRFDKGERSKELRIHINEVCSNHSLDWEDVFWTRAKKSKSFTLDDFEALPRPTEGKWAKPKPTKFIKSLSLAMVINSGLRGK